jgi:hypothetical protein
VNGRSVGDARHNAVEGVDLADEGALSNPADGRVARHDACGRVSGGAGGGWTDCVGLVRDEGCFGANAGGCSGGFASGVAAACFVRRERSFVEVQWGVVLNRAVMLWAHR